MTDAYEYTFGYVMGYEDGLASQSGIASGALLSVPMKGQQVFAHVDCGLIGSLTTCVSDPSPNSYIYDWDEYYFTKFVEDFVTSGTPASVGAAAGYTKACVGATCTPSSLTTIPATKMSVVYTGLDPSGQPGNYTAQPECWINNTTMSMNYLLQLFSTSTSSTTQSIGGKGVVLGWQTQTTSGQECSSSYNLQMSGLDNGGQYLEIETDAAAETACAANLGSTLNTLLSGSGNLHMTCAY